MPPAAVAAPNVKVRVEAQHSSPIWVSMTCCGRTLPLLPFTMTTEMIRYAFSTQRGPVKIRRICTILEWYKWTEKWLTDRRSACAAHPHWTVETDRPAPWKGQRTCLSRISLPHVVFRTLYVRSGRSGVQIAKGVTDSLFSKTVQTGFGAPQPPTQRVSGLSPGDKVAGAWGQPLIFIWCRG